MRARFGRWGVIDIVNFIGSVDIIDPIENIPEPQNIFTSFKKVTLQDTLNIKKEIKSSSSFDFIDKNVILKPFEICGERLVQVINKSIINGEFPEWK
jgi:hypothetical protein